jgi:hypothetical protein
MRRFGLRTRRNGTSAIEFALLGLVWAPLLVGTLGLGTAMIRNLETVQIARDAGHMYARQVKFHEPAKKEMLARIGEGLGMEASGGEGVVILSTVMYVGRYQCQALGLADNATPPNPYASCTNYGHFVFTHRLKVGNPAIGESRFGDPDATYVDATTGAIDPGNSVKRSSLRADEFTLLPKPQEDGTDGFQAGHSAYIAEAIFRTLSMSGVRDGRAYSYSIF